MQPHTETFIFVILNITPLQSLKWWGAVMRRNVCNLFKDWHWGSCHFRIHYVVVPFFSFHSFWMLVKGKGSHCPWARRRVLVYAVWADEELRLAKCQAIITLLNAGLCLALVPFALQLCLFIPLSCASCSLSDVRAIWSGSTSVDILLQSWDSSSLCTASLCASRHLPWLNTLSYTKKGNPLIASTS